MGTAIALVVAGWPLYRLVTAGDLDATSALLRCAVVAVACGYGVTLIVRLAQSYEAQAERERRKRLNALFSDMEGAVAEGSLTGDNVTKAP